MADQPHLTHGLERARLLLAQHRLAELTWDDLSPAERRTVLEGLRVMMARARRRARRSHGLGVLSTVAFIALGGMVFVLGPLAHIGPTGQVEMSDPTFEAQVWLVGVVLIALGVGAADYVLRRRRQLTQLHDRELAAIAETIARGTSRGDG